MLDVMIMWLAELPQSTAHLTREAAYLSLRTGMEIANLGPIPDPGQGKEPPGAPKFETLLAWAKWGALFLCVAGFIIIGARMAIQHKRGEGGGHMASLAMVGAGCVLVASAVAFVDEIV